MWLFFLIESLDIFMEKDDMEHLLEGEISEEHSPFVGTVFHTVVPKVPTVSSLRNRKG